ncbi:protein SFI1 homolog [Mercenaria mercenaria]|uniref:protein SFI1 homolog n=1 Tax=Mercenaria mercenaria TaxID=6596 RepID=UPI00234E7FB4|nr:protein SFI1 homolog [Mercenaria mercenaria]
MTDKPKNVGGDFRLAVLRDLGNQLQIKAERMRLLARAEEGLEDVDYNPYSSTHLPREATSILTEMKVKEPKFVQSHPKSKIPSMMQADNEKKVPGQLQPESSKPATAARQRRRNKVKPGSMGHTTIDIKHYRPGYTWNRGGRMKEIRIRHLARKFLLIWKKKVFGRVTPSQAREHYRLRLLRQTFRVWHEMWWELRKEWRLVVRAECHHRYVLWQRTFRAWREFIERQRIKNAKLALAEKHASTKLTRKCIMGWWLYVHSRRKKNEKNRQALTYHKNRLLRTCWQQWYSSHELVLHRQHIETVALQFWAYRIQAQYWLIWQSKLSDRKSGVMKQYRAVRHHNTIVVRRCFQAWISYWARRRQKMQEKYHCKRLYHNTILTRAFGIWYRAFQYREVLHDRQDRITKLAETFQKRQAFVHWKHCILAWSLITMYILMNSLEKHPVAGLTVECVIFVRLFQSAGFSAFRLCVVQRHLKVMRNEMAAQMRYKHLTQWGWLTWLSRCENKEELKIVTQSHVAWKHYRLVIMRKCFNQLQLYAEWRRHRQAQYAKADAHFYMQEMPKYMFRLKVFVQLMKNKRENAQIAIEFRRENGLARFFYLWVNQYEFSKEYRMNERMAILHYDGKLSKRFFLSWKQKTEDVLQEAEKMEVATEHHNEVLCRRYLSSWRGYIQNIKKSQRQDIEASRYYCRRIMKRCIHAWISYTRLRREKKRKTERARNHYHRRLCQKVIAMWLHYVDTQRAINARVEIMYRRKCLLFLSEAFHTWKDNIGEQKLERHTERVADRHYTLKILAKVFTAWHRFSAIHAYKKSETRQWVESARQHLDSRVVEIYFLKWKAYHIEHMSMKMKYARAVEHHNVKVKLKVMVTWQQFTKESIRKSLLRKQSDWFHNLRLTARCFIAWKHAYSAAQVEKQKSSLALWHWCLNLHRKVLMAWYMYTQQCKHKKSLIQTAMECRRSRLIKNGLTQWLRVADDMSAMRKQMAVQQQAKNVYETYQLVLRCGLHWKAWASKRRQARGGPKPTVSVGDARGRVGTTRVDISAKKVEMGGQSMNSTPRFPSSLFNTPREAPDNHMTSARSHTDGTHEPQLLAPVLTASPGRSKVIRAGGQQIGVQAQPRARPRQPSFLMESLKRAGLFVHDTQSELQTDQVTEDKMKQNLQVSKQTTEIERLNLSNLTTNQSDVDTDRTVTPHDLHQERPGISSTRSEQTVSEYSARVPFKNYGNSREPVSDVAVPCGKQLEKGGQLLLTKLLLNSDLNSDENVIPIQRQDRFGIQQNTAGLNVSNISKFTLMTPADFQSKKDTYIVNKDSTFTPRTVSDVGSTVVSECTSLASTPRVLCQNSDHNHPLSETRSFRVTDFKEQITPRSTSSVTPREQLSSLGFESNSTQMIQKEIIIIRNRLKSFDQKKKKLRKMQKQLKQLCDWLKDIEVKGQDTEDDDVISAKQEVQELSNDVEVLKKSVEEEKTQCASLVERVKVLTSQLTS